MMTPDQILAAFDDVRRAYFPRWDVERRWKLEFGTSVQRRGNTGYCDGKTTTIYVHDDVCRMSDSGLRMFLIHEISHDVAAPGHGREWAKGMEAAAVRAEQLGEAHVARLLRSEIFSYCKFPVFKQVTGLAEPPKF
jgi:hypothetical protein